MKMIPRAARTAAKNSPTARAALWTLGAGLAAALCAHGLSPALAQQSVPPEIAARIAAAQQASAPDELPPFDKVSEGFEKVVSTADGKSMYTLWTRERDAQVLAELPRNFANQRLFIAYSYTGGLASQSGVQFGDMYASWRAYDKRLALVEPELMNRTTDRSAQRSVDQAFTDRVILDTPQVARGPGGGPVINLHQVLVGQAHRYFGAIGGGANRGLVKLVKAKAFPDNIELAFEMPMATGRLITLHYSISVLPENTGYTPRDADSRVGYFTAAHRDLADPADDEPFKRSITRWKLEKADPKLKMSPPKEPIVFYLEHTTPVRYRRWVREGVLMWNEAFERIGIQNAVEVRQQDATTGAYMDIDPEDVRYNFIRWNTNAAPYAIGPSRIDPRTGQILDADVVMNDGLLRFFADDFRSLVEQAGMDRFHPETLAWLDARPQWDPRVRFAPPQERAQMLARRAARASCAAGSCAHGGEHGAAAPLMGRDSLDGLAGRVSQVNGLCTLGGYANMAITLAHIARDVMFTEADKDGVQLDGVPEDFIGGMLRYVTAHEVGHTLGLRHNFVASTLHDLATLNSDGFADDAPVAGSVMDYLTPNINFHDGDRQGPWTMNRLGPYDLWAIEYGYTLEKDLKTILARVSEPGLQYATDEDTWGPDPRAQRWVIGEDSLAFAESRMRLVQHMRGRILDEMVKEGQSWARARRAYQTLLANHVQALSAASDWVGGSFVNRDKKGDPGDRPPIENVDADKQRRALDFVLRNAFEDEAFGVTPELLTKMTVEKWWDDGGFNEIFTDETYNVHDQILNVQSMAMTMLLNPTRLRRVYDNEMRVPSGDDAITLAEVLEKVSASVWAELGAQQPTRRHTAREPMISSLRRNLQREHLERLIDLSLPGGLPGAAGNAISTLSTHNMRTLYERIDTALTRAAARLDPYSVAHLTDAKVRIEKALDAQYIYNASSIGGGSMTIVLPFGAGN